jgi:hypothetical protein
MAFCAQKSLNRFGEKTGSFLHPANPPTSVLRFLAELASTIPVFIKTVLLYCANISEFNLFYTGRRFGKPNPMEKKV